MTKMEKYRDRIAEMLDLYWLSVVECNRQCPNSVALEVSKGRYEGATNLVTQMGFDWKRDDNGKHKVFGTPIDYRK